MTLPDNFSSWEHFQSTLRRVQNRIVRDEFSDVGDEDWTPDISIPRGSLRVACTLDDNDTVVQTLCRLFYYYFVLRKARDLQPPIYGFPDGSDRIKRATQPQIMLFFQEDFNDVDPDFSPVTGEISFRLMDKNPETITETDLQQLATKIKTLFALPQGFIWKKGKEYFTYSDWKKGYQLQILARSESEAKQVIEQVLDIQGHSPEWEKLNESKNNVPHIAYPIIPEKKRILSKQRTTRRKRPIADVRFQYAIFTVDGLPVPIPLVDRSGIFRNALEAVFN